MAAMGLLGLFIVWEPALPAKVRWQGVSIWPDPVTTPLRPPHWGQSKFPGKAEPGLKPVWEMCSYPGSGI